MGFFQNLNREFEGELVEDIASRLGSYHSIQAKMGRVACHQVKCSFHTKMAIELKNGLSLELHYCGGMGYGLLDGGGDWGELDWMMTPRIMQQKELLILLNI